MKWFTAADKRMAQTEAEKRRALAVAREQEMTALDRENRARVTLAEAEIPLAIAKAFGSGRLGTMDYYCPAQAKRFPNSGSVESLPCLRLSKSDLKREPLRFPPTPGGRGGCP